jgi:hypothetical protein
MRGAYPEANADSMPVCPNCQEIVRSNVFRKSRDFRSIFKTMPDFRGDERGTEKNQESSLAKTELSVYFSLIQPFRGILPGSVTVARVTLTHLV